jgi:2-octaprenyl-6-methoxyphenol hydroxylase
MTKVPSCPIDEIYVSDRGHLGQARLKEHSGMGNVLALADLGKQLLEQIKDTDIDYFCPYKIAQVERSAAACSIIIESSSQNNSSTSFDSKPSEAAIGLKAKLVIIAEGGSAPSMAFFNLAQSTVSYEQTAFIANVITQQPHRNRAFERFTEQGPVALLPMTSPLKQTHSRHSSSQQMSLVWTCDKRQAESISALDDDAFLHKLQQLFGDKLGRLEASSPRFSYPLKLVKARQYSGHRVLCIGNAAQSLHPIAGQGFNLGVRDIDALVQVIKKGDDKSAKTEEAIVDPGAFVVTNEYKKQREHDKSAVITATDTLVRLFSNQYLPTVVGRNIGLIALNHAPQIKNRLSSFAMGKRKRMR